MSDDIVCGMDGNIIQTDNKVPADHYEHVAQACPTVASTQAVSMCRTVGYYHDYKRSPFHGKTQDFAETGIECTEARADPGIGYISFA